MNLKIHTLMIFFILTAVSHAGEPRVAGLDYLIVIDPAVQEAGRPTPVIAGDQVDIPPTLHIHPYYYSGDLEFQAPIIEGGPTIIVAKHPRSNEKLYIDATLPPGAPVIAYTDGKILYIYENQRVILEFLGLRRCKVDVKYVSGIGIGRKFDERRAELHSTVIEAKKQSRLYSEFRELTHDTGNVIKGSVGVLGSAGAFAIERVRIAAEFVPGVKPLMSIGEQSAERGAREEVRQAGLEQLRDVDEFISTVR